MPVNRPSPTKQSSSSSASSASSPPPPDPPLTDKEKEALRLEEQLRLHTAIVAQWQQRKHRALPSPTPASLSLHPHAHPTVRFKTLFRNTILSVFRERGWAESTDEVEWDVHWTSKEWTKGVLPKIHLLPHQRINHFRNYYELTRKDLLIKNLKRQRNGLLRAGRTSEAALLSFFPDTFNLPSEYLLFVDAFRRGGMGAEGPMGNSWIMKPIGSSQGKGIFLVNRLHQVAEWSSTVGPAVGADEDGGGVERYIVQRYIGDPLLIGGKKFDLRLYVLVTCYHPLTAYMHRQGFARFSSTRYSTLRGELGNSFVHLTNVAIQKTGDDYDERSGGKWDVAGLRRYLLSSRDSDGAVHAVDECFAAISSLVVHSLLSVQPLMIADPHCFELYGYDVLLDAQLKPWLIEVNASPSLSANTAADEAMKKEMLHDVFHVLEMERWRKERKARGGGGTERGRAGEGGSAEGGWEKVGDFDLLYDEKGMRMDRDGRPLNCLGLFNDRVRELRAMWRRMRSIDERDAERLARASQDAKEQKETQRDKRKAA